MVKKIKQIQVCPNCGSPDIEPDWENHASILLNTNAIKKCNNCSHKGQFFPSIPLKDLKKPLSKEKAKNKQFIDETFSRGYSRLPFAIYGLLLIIFSLILIYYSSFYLAIPLFLIGFLFLLYSIFNIRGNKKLSKSFFWAILIIIFLYYIFLLILTLIEK